MNDKKDEFKECIAREFEEIAREEEEFLENDTSLVVPEGTKEAVLARVREQIRAYEMEQAEKEAKEREKPNPFIMKKKQGKGKSPTLTDILLKG